MGYAEHKIEGYLMSKADEMDIWHAKFTSPGLDGVPDQILIMKGLTVYVECKSENGHTSAIQNVRIREMAKHGAIVHVACSRSEIDAILACGNSKTSHRALPTCAGPDYKRQVTARGKKPGTKQKNSRTQKQPWPM